MFFWSYWLFYSSPGPCRLLFQELEKIKNKSLPPTLFLKNLGREAKDFYLALLVSKNASYVVKYNAYAGFNVNTNYTEPM